MARILILYSTTDGHTLEICQRLQQLIARQGHDVDLVSLSDEPEVNLMDFDKVVIGASIRYGKHRPEVFRFMKLNRATLQNKPNAFFSVNVVARKPEKCQPDTNPYLKKYLKQLNWRPAVLAVFAGKIDYQKYSFGDRLMIRFIMWITHGPTDPKTVIDFTNWNQVDDFAQTIIAMQAD